MMKIAELYRGLEGALRQAALSKATDEAVSKALSQLFADFQDMEVAEFCLKAREGLQRAKSKAVTRTRAPKPADVAPTPAKSVIEIYLGELEQTKIDSRQFEEVVNRMKKDKSVGAAAADEIARRFTGSSQTYKTKPVAAKAILKRQITNLRNAGKLKQIDGIF
jgi:hypothetical protein